ncbi:hypothetical protein IAD21_00297 [Abditibacteriota bacterium]|nr:hypothetical protein IAD21_00297 [Abditibacteriota bacterium]
MLDEVQVRAVAVGDIKPHAEERRTGLSVGDAIEDHLLTIGAKVHTAVDFKLAQVHPRRRSPIRGNSIGLRGMGSAPVVKPNLAPIGCPDRPEPRQSRQRGFASTRDGTDAEGVGVDESQLLTIGALNRRFSIPGHPISIHSSPLWSHHGDGTRTTCGQLSSEAIKVVSKVWSLP